MDFPVVDESGKAIQAVLQAIPSGVVHVKNRQIIWANRSGLILGYQDHQVVGMDVRRIYGSQEDYDRVGREGYAQIFQGQIYRTQVKLARVDGAGMICELTGQAVDAQNPELGTIWTVRDLTAEQEAKQWFENLFRFNPALMSLTMFLGDVQSCSPEDRILKRRLVDVNNSFLKLLGYSREEVIGKTAWELGIFPDEAARKLVMEHLLRHGRLMNLELPVRCRDGRILYGLFSSSIIPTQNQELYLTVMQDITERQRVIQLLRDSEERLRCLDDNLPSGMVYQLKAARDGSRRQFIFLSAGVERICGLTVAEVCHDASLLYHQILTADHAGEIF